MPCGVQALRRPAQEGTALARNCLIGEGPLNGISRRRGDARSNIFYLEVNGNNWWVLGVFPLGAKTIRVLGSSFRKVAALVFGRSIMSVTGDA